LAGRTWRDNGGTDQLTYPFRVMVVEDDDALRAALVRALRLEGYAVDEATDGARALAQLASLRADLVVLDVMLPEVDGLTVCQRLRATGDRTPVLLLTARDLVSDRVQGLKAGADDYLTKPFAVDELLARVQALIRRSCPGHDSVVGVADLSLKAGRSPSLRLPPHHRAGAVGGTRGPPGCVL
jgi:two-component system, OmpR family, response regulator MprA